MDLLSVRALPFLARRNYYYEFKHLLLWSALAGLIEGQFASIVVAKTFGGGKLLITIATATPAASHMFSLFWGMLCVGRPKVRLLTMLAVGAVLLTGMVGAIPTTPVGAVWFIVQIAAVQILLAGVVTVRSALWKSNYPQVVRGRIAARLQQQLGKADDKRFVEAAYETILAVKPTGEEMAACREALKQTKELLVRRKHPQPSLRARENLVHALLNHNDFITIR